MIPLHKFKTLPRTLRLRKAASIFGNAEHRLIVSGELPAAEVEYFRSVAEFLFRDEGLPNAAANALKAAQKVFASVALGGETGELRRALNTARHILLTETGKTQADWDFFESSGALDSSKRQPFPGMQVYFDDIRSPFNVGSMFRAADSFGVEKIWLSPLCADPLHKRAERTAMGCVDIVPWERLSGDPFSSGESQFLHAPADFKQGPLFALETGGTALAEFPFPAQGILIAGSEELGISPRALAAADASLGRVSIPTRGVKGSLNVSVAFGIVAQAWAERLGKS